MLLAERRAGPPGESITCKKACFNNNSTKFTTDRYISPFLYRTNILQASPPTQKNSHDSATRIQKGPKTQGGGSGQEISQAHPDRRVFPPAIRCSGGQLTFGDASVVGTAELGNGACKDLFPSVGCGEENCGGVDGGFKSCYVWSRVLWLR